MSTSSFTTIVENVFRRTGSWKRIKAELSVYYWPRIVGGEIAKNVIAERYFNGYLCVKTESSTLAHQLTMMTPDILKRYQTLLGANILKGVRIKVGSVPHSVNRVPKKDCGPVLRDDEVKLIRESCQPLADPELSQRFQKLMERSFKNRRRRESQGGGKCLSCNVPIDLPYSYCPVCEVKLKDEILSYIGYLKKNHQKIKLSDLPLEINEANEILIRRILGL
jgi:hypothetical protein